MPIRYNSIQLDAGFRLDLLIEKKPVIELKAVEAFLSVHTAQVLTYLKLANLRYGLLINFNVSVLYQGVKRVVNGY